MDGKMAGGARDSFSDEAMLALASSSGPLAAVSIVAKRSASVLSTVPLVPTTSNQSEVISKFLCEVDFLLPRTLVIWSGCGMRWRTA